MNLQVTMFGDVQTFKVNREKLVEILRVYDTVPSSIDSRLQVLKDGGTVYLGKFSIKVVGGFL